MILLNFSHPLTGQQRTAIEIIKGFVIEQLVDIPCQYDSSAESQRPEPDAVAEIINLKRVKAKSGQQR
jgi:hypothetical protein